MIIFVRTNDFHAGRSLRKETFLNEIGEPIMVVYCWAIPEEYLDLFSQVMGMYYYEVYPLDYIYAVENKAMEDFVLKKFEKDFKTYEEYKNSVIDYWSNQDDDLMKKYEEDPEYIGKSFPWEEENIIEEYHKEYSEYETLLNKIQLEYFDPNKHTVPERLIKNRRSLYYYFIPYQIIMSNQEIYSMQVSEGSYF